MILCEPTGKQARSIVEATARLNLWHGAVRSSKTIGSLMAFIHYLATTPHLEHLVVGKTRDTLRRNITAPMRAMLKRDELHTNWGLGEAHLWGKTLYLVGANDERSEEKIRGMTAGGGYLDELTTWPQSMFDMFRTRCSLKGARMFATTNPESPRHWAKLELLDRERHLDMRSWHFTIDDNPHLDPDYVANIKREYTGLWYKRFIEGRWVIAEGAIWDMFPGDDDSLIVKTLPRMLRYWMGVDYGTVNPFVALLIGQSSPEAEPDRRSRLYVCREWRWDSKQKRRQLTDSEYSKRIRTWVRRMKVTPAAWFVDPSAASFILQLNRDGAQRVQAADNAVLDGIRSVATLFSNDLLRVHESCTGLIDECYAYIWDEKAQERGEDKPMKTDDHGPDALRYPVRMLTSLWQSWVRDLNQLAGKVA